MNIHHKLFFEYEEKQEIALLTVTASTGPNPAQVGNMMIIDKEGNVLEGTIAGGVIEKKAIQKAIKLIEKGKSETINVVINDESGETCAGAVDVFVQVFVQRDEIIIIGAGNIGHSVYKIAEMLDYNIVVVDDRPEYASKERFPEAKSIITGNFEETLKTLKIGKNSNIIISTHSHEYDELALSSVADSEAVYIGMLSNRKKAERILKNLSNKGIGQEKMEKIYCPVGLNIGGSKPGEIAVSIMAEILALKYGKRSNFGRGKE